MRYIKIEYPNPVLAPGRDDYISGCEFYTIIKEDKVYVDSENIVIPVSYKLVCKGLECLIKEGKAVVAINVRCSALSYRRIFCFTRDKTEMVISIPKFNVAKKIELTGSIIASIPNKSFRCEKEFNDVYFSGATFDIQKGDILALDSTQIIPVDDSELEKPISSIFSIVKSETTDCSETICPDFYDDKIKVNVSKDLYDNYHAFKEDNNGAFLRYASGILIYPVLVEAVGIVLKVLKEGDEELEEKRWFRTIMKKSEFLQINLTESSSSAVSIANKLLGDIAVDALKGLKTSIEDEFNSEETIIKGGRRD